MATDPFAKFLHGIDKPKPSKVPAFKPFKKANASSTPANQQNTSLPKLKGMSTELPKITLPSATPTPQIKLNLPKGRTAPTTTASPATKAIIQHNQGLKTPKSNIQFAEPTISKPVEMPKPSKFERPSIDSLKREEAARAKANRVKATTATSLAEMFPSPTESAVRYAAISLGVDVDKYLDSRMMNALMAIYKSGMNSVDYYKIIMTELGKLADQSVSDRIQGANEPVDSSAPTTDPMTSPDTVTVTAPNITGAVGQWKDTIVHIATDYGISSNEINSFTALASAIIYGESGGDANKLGDSGKSAGLLQLYTGGGQGNAINPQTNKPYTIDELKDPTTNLSIGLQYIVSAWKSVMADHNLKSWHDILYEVMAQSGHPSRKGLEEHPEFFDTVFNQMETYIKDSHSESTTTPDATEFLATESLPNPFDGDFGITSYFGANDVAERKGAHTGVDFGMPIGTPLKATLPGKIISAKPNGGFGLEVLVQVNIGGENWILQYGHLSSASVKEGDMVAQGDVVGLSGGATGNPTLDGTSTGAHLHFGVKTPDGQWTDPIAFMRGKSYLVEQTGMTPQEVFDKVGWSEDVLNNMIEKYVNGYTPNMDWRSMMQNLIIKLHHWNTGETAQPQAGDMGNTLGTGDETRKVGASESRFRTTQEGSSVTQPGSTFQSQEEIQNISSMFMDMGYKLTPDEEQTFLNTIKFGDSYLSNLAQKAYQTYQSINIQNLADKGITGVETDLTKFGVKETPEARQIGNLTNPLQGVMDKFYEDVLHPTQRVVFGPIVHSMGQVSNDLYGSEGPKDLLSLLTLLPVVNVPAGLKKAYDEAQAGNWDSALADLFTNGIMGMVPPALTNIPRQIYEGDRPYLPEPGESLSDFNTRTANQYDSEVNPLKIRTVVELGADPFNFMGLKTFAAAYLASEGISPSSAVIAGMAALGPGGKFLHDLLPAAAAEVVDKGANKAIRAMTAKSFNSLEAVVGQDMRQKLEAALHEKFPGLLNGSETPTREDLVNWIDETAKGLSPEDPFNVAKHRTQALFTRVEPGGERQMAFNKTVIGGGPERNAVEAADLSLSFEKRAARGLPTTKTVGGVILPEGSLAHSEYAALQESMPKGIGQKSFGDNLADATLLRRQDDIISMYRAGALTGDEATAAFVNAYRPHDPAELATLLERKLNAPTSKLGRFIERKTGPATTRTVGQTIKEYLDIRKGTALADVAKTSGDLTVDSLVAMTEKRARELWRSNNDAVISVLRERHNKIAQYALSHMDSVYMKAWRGILGPTMGGTAKLILGYPGYVIGNVLEDLTQGALHGGGMPRTRGNWRRQLEVWFGENWHLNPEIPEDIRRMMMDPVVGKAVKQATKDFTIEAPAFQRFKNIFRASKPEFTGSMTQAEAINAIATKARKSLKDAGHDFSMQSAVDFITQITMSDLYLNMSRKFTHRIRAQFLLQDYKNSLNRVMRDTYHLRSEEYKRAVRLSRDSLPENLPTGVRSEITDMFNAAMYSDNPVQGIQRIKDRFGQDQVLKRTIQELFSQPETWGTIPEASRNMLWYRLGEGKKDIPIDQFVNEITTTFRASVHSEMIMQAAHNINAIIPELHQKAAAVAMGPMDVPSVLGHLNDYTRIGANLSGVPYFAHNQAFKMADAMPEAAHAIWDEADGHIISQWEETMNLYKTGIEKLRDRMRAEGWSKEETAFLDNNMAIVDLNRKTWKESGITGRSGKDAMDIRNERRILWEDHYKKLQKINNDFLTILDKNKDFSSRINKWVKQSATDKQKKLVHTYLRSLETTDAWTPKMSEAFIKNQFGGPTLYGEIFKDRVRFQKYADQLQAKANLLERQGKPKAKSVREAATLFSNAHNAWKDSTNFADRVKLEQELNKAFRYTLGARYDPKKWVKIVLDSTIYEQRKAAEVEGIGKYIEESSAKERDLGENIANIDNEISNLEDQLTKMRRAPRGSRKGIEDAQRELKDIGNKPAGKLKAIPPPPPEPRLVRLSEPLQPPKMPVEPNAPTFDFELGGMKPDEFQAMLDAHEAKLRDVSGMYSEEIGQLDEELSKVYRDSKPLVAEYQRLHDKYLTFQPLDNQPEVDAVRNKLVALADERGRLKGSGGFTPEKAQRLAEIDGEMQTEIRNMQRTVEVAKSSHMYPTDYTQPSPAELQFSFPQEGVTAQNQDELQRLISSQGMTTKESEELTALQEKIDTGGHLTTVERKHIRSLEAKQRHGENSLYTPSSGAETISPPAGQLGEARSALQQALPPSPDYATNMEKYADYVETESLLRDTVDKLEDVKRMRDSIIGKKQALGERRAVERGPSIRRTTAGGEVIEQAPKAGTARTGQLKSDLDAFKAQRDREVSQMEKVLNKYADDFETYQTDVKNTQGLKSYRDWNRIENLRKIQQRKNAPLELEHKFDIAAYLQQYGPAIRQNKEWRSALGKWAYAHKKANDQLLHWQDVLDRFETQRTAAQNQLYSFKEHIRQLKTRLVFESQVNQEHYLERMRKIDDFDSMIANSTGYAAIDTRSGKVITEGHPNANAAEIESIIQTHKDLGTLNPDLYSDPNFSENFINEMFKGGMPPRPGVDATIEEKLLWHMRLNMAQDLEKTASQAAWMLTPDIYANKHLEADQQVNALLERVKNIGNDPLSNPDNQTAISAWADNAAAEVSKIPEWDRKQITDIRKQAMGQITEDARNAYTRYDNQTVFDYTMQHIFPFWQYETRRFGRLYRNFERHPATLRALLTYYDTSDRGYVEAGGTGYFFRPDAGTLWTGAGLLDPRATYSSMPGIAGQGEDVSNFYQKAGLFSPIMDTAISTTNALENRDPRFMSDSLMSGVGIQNPINAASMLGTPLPGIGKTIPGGQFVSKLATDFRDTLGDNWNTYNVDNWLADQGYNADEVREAADLGKQVAPVNSPFDLIDARDLLASANSNIAGRNLALDLNGGMLYRSPDKRKHAEERKNLIMSHLGMTSDQYDQLLRSGGLKAKLDLSPKFEESLSNIPGAGQYDRSFNSAFATKDEQKNRLTVDRFYRALRSARSNFTANQLADDAKLQLPSSDMTHAIWIENHKQRERERGQLPYAMRSHGTDYSSSDITDNGVPITVDEWNQYNDRLTTSYARQDVSPLDRILNDYYKISPDSFPLTTTFDDGTQKTETDWPKFYAARERLLNMIPENEPELKQAVMFQINKNKTTVEKEFERAANAYSYYRSLKEFDGMTDEQAAQYKRDQQEIQDKSIQMKSPGNLSLSEKQDILFRLFDLRTKWKGFSTTPSQERQDYLKTEDGKLMQTWFRQQEGQGPTTIK